jgi:hypothetical protein
LEEIIPAPKQPQKLPVILSPEEVLEFLACVRGSNHRTIDEAQQDYRDRYEALTGSSLRDCPVCYRGRMIVIRVIDPYAVPAFTNTS